MKGYADTERAINSLVLTITEFPEIDTVQFLIEGIVVEDINGFRLDESFERPTYINLLSGTSNNEDKLLQVYFSDANALYLIPVAFAINENSTVIQMLDSAMQELLKGPPPGSYLERTIWPDTGLISISYDSENSLAIINLSKEAVGYDRGNVTEMLLVNSILFTITDIDEVDRVQILIEGETIEHLLDGIDTSVPLIRPGNINYINP